MKQAEIYFAIKNVLAYIGLGATAVVTFIYVFWAVYIWINNRRWKIKAKKVRKTDEFDEEKCPEDTYR